MKFKNIFFVIFIAIINCTKDDVATEPEKPAIPENFIATVINSNEINLSWDGVEDITKYILYDGVKILSSNITETRFSHTGLTDGSPHRYSLVACKGEVCSLATDIVTVATFIKTAKDIKAIGVSPTQININWTAVTGATKYNVFDNGEKLEREAYSNSYSHTGLKSGSKHEYSIASCNSVVCSEKSDVVVSYTALPIPTFLPPVVGSLQIRLFWPAVANATYYAIFDNETIVSSGIKKTNFIHKNLKSGSTHKYTLKACNDGGCSAPSSPLSATTELGAPYTPTGLKASAISSSQINLSWNATSRATYYQLFNGTAYVSQNISANFFFHSGLDPNSSHSYTLKACNTSGCSNASTAVTVTTKPDVPSTPTGLTASVVSSSQINLSWTTTARATYYKLLDGTNDVDNNITKTSFSHSALSPSSSHSYTLIACNSSGCSAASTAITATTNAGAPSTPTGIKASAVSSSKINLSWTTTPGATYYKLFDGLNTINSNIKTTTFSHSGLNANSTHSYTLVACNSIGCSAISTVVPASTLNVAPSTPTGITASVVSSSQINLSWNTTARATHYQLLDGTKIIDNNIKTSSFSHSALSPASSHSYTLKACNATGCSNASTAISATTKPDAPAKPTGLTASIVSSSQINLSWTTTPGATYYKLLDGTNDVDNNITKTSYSHSALSPASSHSYTLIACNSVGCSSISNVVSASTLDIAPSTPTGLTASVVSSSQINLSWTTTARATYYQLLDGTKIIDNNIKTTSYSHSVLSPASSHSYTLKACNTGGCSNASTAITATTKPDVPSNPTGLAASVVSSSKINLSWAATSGATYYQLLDGTTVINNNIKTTSYSHSALSPASSHSYTLKACNTSGCSNASTAITATTKPDVPSTPTGLAASVVSSSKINLSWAATSGATHYQLLDGTTVIDNNITTTSYSHSGLSASSSHSYTLIACNTGGCSTASTTVSATTSSGSTSSGSGNSINNVMSQSSAEVNKLLLSVDYSEARFLESAKALKSDNLSATNVQKVKKVFTKSEWGVLFPLAKSLYTYENFLKAVSRFPKFCGEANQSDKLCKQELAYMFAHFAQETGYHGGDSYTYNGETVPEYRQGLYHLKESGCPDGAACSNYQNYCANPTASANLEKVVVWGCGDGTKKYFGRGPKQISYPYNYANISMSYYGEYKTLTSSPDNIIKNGGLALFSAMWFYMIPQLPKPSSHEIATGLWRPSAGDISSNMVRGFGLSNNVINGGLECGSSHVNNASALNRQKYYKLFATYFNIPVEDNTEISCNTQSTFSDATYTNKTNRTATGILTNYTFDVWSQTHPMGKWDANAGGPGISGKKIKYSEIICAPVTYSTIYDKTLGQESINACVTYIKNKYKGLTNPVEHTTGVYIAP